jgi:hypothetical protein
MEKTETKFLKGCNIFILNAGSGGRRHFSNEKRAPATIFPWREVRILPGGLFM